MKKNVVIFASGNGSNFVNIYKCINKGKINAKLVLLISNNPQCGAVIFAKKNGIDYKIINDYRYPIENNRNKQYELVLKYYKTDLILLAGFMKKIPQNIVKIYKNKILNIHPSLLPNYGGKGFYGMKVHNAVINANEKFSGATVHIVNDEYDKGSIIAQEKIKVSKSDTAEILAAKVLKIEHSIYPKAVRMFCLDKININNNDE
tara:strand:+ start:269 stop:880 length:612 start_codon:yes stop_codon:yes gene_type:complete